MRTMDDIAVTAETILSLGIEELPTSDRALRRYAERNVWPVLYDRLRKTHFLVDGIPEPFGPLIRAALGRPLPDVPAPFRPPAGSQSSTSRHMPEAIMEARLVILFEVFRRAAYMPEAMAVRSVVEEARFGGLPTYLLDLIDVATPTRGPRRLADGVGNQGPIPPKGQDCSGLHEADAGKRRHARGSDGTGTPRAAEPEYITLSCSTLRRWIDLFNRHGAKGLLPAPR